MWYIKHMKAVVIPKNMSKKGDLVVIPRSDYEALFRDSSQAKADWIYEKPVAKYVRTRISKAETEFKKGKAVKWQGK